VKPRLRQLRMVGRFLSVLQWSWRLGLQMRELHQLHLTLSKRRAWGEAAARGGSDGKVLVGWCSAAWSRPRTFHEAAHGVVHLLQGGLPLGARR
jgi:hypothetical protein